MSAPQHTPGPLELVQSLGASANGAFHLYLTDASDRKIAALWGGQDEKLANGHLFSAAPDLLAASAPALHELDAVIPLVRDDRTRAEMQAVADKLRAAIAKAKGEA